MMVLAMQVNLTPQLRICLLFLHCTTVLGLDSNLQYSD